MTVKKTVRGATRTAARARKTHRAGAPKNTVRAPSRSEAPAIHGRPYPIVGIGASAGGFEAFRELLQELPPDTGLAFVLVQHLDPGHESMLTRLLSKTTAMVVTEVSEGMRVQPNHAYVIPPNATMTIRGGTLHLKAGREVSPLHMPIDQFLSSLAEDQRNRAIGVVLSGTASDGTIGLKSIKAEGGITFAQDPKSAKYDGMPRSAIAANCVDFVLSPGGIAKELTRIGRHPYLEGAGKVETAVESPAGAGTDLQKIFGLLRKASGVDFLFYKPTTIKRRILRRMALQKSESLKKYLKLLQETPAELDKLYEDILIHVTAFFRESEAFDAIRDEFLPKVLKSKPRGEPIRVWVPGCSTGEEAYSVAIVLLERLGDRAADTPIQIFGTDISEASIEKARVGFYAAGSLADVSPERLRRFFVKTNGGYQVTKSVRELCVFARQDLAKDPPFSRMDLISCRNVLIYMGAILQKKVMSVFHYALKPDAFLVLGKSESITGFADLFALADRAHRIYQKKAADIRPLFDLTVGYPRIATDEAAATADLPVPFDAQKEADRIVLGRYAPAGLIVNENLQILHFRGTCSPYLAPAPGEASLNLLRMVRPEFAVELRTAVHRARKQQAVVRKEGIHVQRDGHELSVSLEIVPFKGYAGEQYLLVLFEDARISEAGPSGARAGKPRKEAGADIETGRLQRELRTTKEYLQSIIEEQEATNEELKSANEEVLSSNEELQSTNEELETAKEELQSTNEELVTVNEQMQNRNVELGQVNDDLANLLAGVNIPIVMLDRGRCVRRFTPLAEALLNLLPGDVGRPIGNIRSNVEVGDLTRLLTEVLDTVSVRQLEVQSHDGHWYSMVLRPYRTLDNRIDGVVMIFIDIDALKRAHFALDREQKFSAAVLESASAMVAVTDLDGRVVRFNRACQQVSGRSFEAIEGKVVWDEVLAAGERRAMRAIYRRLADERIPIEHENAWLDQDGGAHLISWASVPMSDSAGVPRFVVAVGSDITERRRIEQELHRSEAALRESQQQLQSLAAGLISAQERERERIALELHDDLNQRVAAMMMEVHLLLSGAPPDRKDIIDGLTELGNRLAALSADLRLTAHTLHPAALDRLGLGPGLRSLCDDFTKQRGFKVRFASRAIRAAVPPNVALCLYRVLQEALANAAAHSGAEDVRVALASRGDTILLSISDDGRGFVVGNETAGGLGMISMRERVRQIGGTFAIRSKPGEGTQINIEIPPAG